jgi:triacylglycerol lipase
MMKRRSLIATLLAAAAWLGGCAALPSPPDGQATPPIVFVHGNGDSAALWLTTLWRFESNGWPRERLHALQFPDPLARDDDTVAQAARSSSAEQRATLAAEVTRVLAATGAPKVVLIGNSRGGNAIRDYIQNGGGDKTVSHAILGGTPNHGVWASPDFLPRSEFNGAGPFLTGLNSPKGPNGDEVTPGVRWLTIRSDNNDKYAQPEGDWIGQKGKPTGIGFDGPALKGAENLVLPGRDHREVSYHPQAFAAAYRFLTGRAPAADIVPEDRVTLDGTVTGFEGTTPTNLPLAGARVVVLALDPVSGQRRGTPLADRSVGADGRWGPVVTDSRTPLEFVIGAEGYAITHIFRSPFPRSSAIVHLRPERLTDADKGGIAVLNLTRPRGYFGLPRDHIVLDGNDPPPGIPSGVAGVAAAKVKTADANRRAVAEYTSGMLAERIVGWAWPARDNHVNVFELHY